MRATGALSALALYLPMLTCPNAHYTICPHPSMRATSACLATPLQLAMGASIAYPATPLQPAVGATIACLATLPELAVGASLAPPAHPLQFSMRACMTLFAIVCSPSMFALPARSGSFVATTLFAIVSSPSMWAQLV
eukprot:CAMPEP_0183568450 /NCGR_PEP_ID=MMETSP0371-20130417/117321_1 /TAXON_ID=268820 /ORGANISM="Peridinium aciculiferum, Strain PAER-2" /LENGTH=136 /DNA_ID=CAMNT_0025777955 /DNA_START=108 /DNA_END=515 /DNA_ORIENTATION=-